MNNSPPSPLVSTIAAHSIPAQPAHSAKPPPTNNDVGAGATLDGALENRDAIDANPPPARISNESTENNPGEVNLSDVQLAENQETSPLSAEDLISPRFSSSIAINPKRTLFQPKDLAVLSMQCIIDQHAADIGYLYIRVSTGENISVDMFDSIVAKIHTLTTTHYEPCCHALTRLGFDCSNANNDIGLRLFNFLCHRYLKSLGGNEKEDLLTKIALHCPNIESQRTIATSKEKEIANEGTSLNTTALATAEHVRDFLHAAILGPFATYLKLNLQLLSNEQLQVLHMEINNSTTAISLMNRWSTSPQLEKIYSDWLAFVNDVNEFALDQCLTHLTKMTHHEFFSSHQLEAFYDILGRALSINLEYYKHAELGTLEFLRSKRLIDKMTLVILKLAIIPRTNFNTNLEMPVDTLLKESLYGIPNRGLLNVIYLIDSQCKTADAADRSFWQNLFGDILQDISHVLDQRATNYEECFEEFEALSDTLRHSDTFFPHDPVQVWSDLKDQYEHLVFYSSLCDTINVHQSLRPYATDFSAGDRQPLALQAFEERFNNLVNNSKGANSKVKQLFTDRINLLEDYLAANPFSKEGFEDVIDDFYALHDLGKAIGFSTITLDAPLLEYLIKTFQSTGDLQQDITFWQDILTLYSDIASAAPLFEDIATAQNQNICFQLKIGVRNLLDAHQKTYAPLLKQPLPDLSELSYLQSLCNANGFGLTFVDIAMLDHSLRNFQSRGSLKNDLNFWKDITKQYVQIADWLYSQNPMLAQLREMITARFCQIIERYLTSFDAADFSQDLSNSNFFLKFSELFGVDLQIIHSALQPTNESETVSGKGKEKEKK